jgi:Fur family transcriptional regulator, zinc uptake regulator
LFQTNESETMQTRGMEMQKAVFQVLEENEKPMSAYDILKVLRASHARLAPTTIYRALHALCARGRAHRIESLNAFAARRSTAPCEAVILSICEDCGAVEETAAADLLNEVVRSVGRSGFAPSRHVVELHGHCRACAKAGISA